VTRFDPPAINKGGGLHRSLLLASLSPADQALLLPHLRLRSAKRGDVLFHPGESVDAAFLPCGALVSLVIVTAEGRTAEAGLVGAEGLIGGLVATGAHPAFSRAIVQLPGDIASIGLRALNAAKQESPSLRDTLARVADCLMAQILQTVACNVRHSLEKRLARWLLSLRDELASDELPVTQEYLAELLGVQRTTITACASQFQAQGLIRYARGRIVVTDADGLNGRSCRCRDSVQLHKRLTLPVIRR
jgi:CRP-like cAMP-binding protein